MQIDFLFATDRVSREMGLQGTLIRDGHGIFSQPFTLIWWKTGADSRTFAGPRDSFQLPLRAGGFIKRIVCL